MNLNTIVLTATVTLVAAPAFAQVIGPGKDVPEIDALAGGAAIAIVAAAVALVRDRSRR